MAIQLDDTIAAIASPPGPAARGIVRLSGPDTLSVVRAVFVGQLEDGSVPVRVTGSVDVGSADVRLPLHTDLLVWPTHRSYTGQPMAEFHTVGAPPLLDLVLESLFAHGARPAERGEFTMRAFLNGRIDLIQAEAVVGVIDAADHEELRNALTQLGGGLTRQLRQLQADIIAVLGDLEAGLDFVEEDIEFISSAEIVRRLRHVQIDLEVLLAGSRDRLPSGYRPRVVLAGLPNAGKSTLFNRLTELPLAIESAEAGTTRDYLCSPVQLGELTIDLIDTAGWETASHGIIEQAQGLRSKQLESADLVIWCSAADLSAKHRIADEQLRSDMQRSVPVLLPVTTCVDRTEATVDSDDALAISAVIGTGLNELRSRLARELNRTQSSRGELLATASVRCRDSLRRALTTVESAIRSVETQAGDEITAIDLRATLSELSSILGETYTDDILDHIFSSFCIGK